MAKKNISAELRRLVRDRAGDCCEYCRGQAKYSADSFSIDHIKPRGQQGETEPENLALSCIGCNQHKAKRTSAVDPATDQLVALFHPRRHHWEEHFAWSDDFTLMLGLTPTGRATIAALQLNRAGLVNLRRVLRASGEHPPSNRSG
ncbi:MAG TPA: HNH endonuclease signature motif containing protein [Blastocatellia bacterium]|nr:HNH endonuclease signature motif containing protein [Blastocatellia bacterium]